MYLLQLSENFKLAAGSSQKVYQHPECSDLLVKVLTDRVPARPRRMRKRFKRWLKPGLNWFKTSRPLGRHYRYLRELDQALKWPTDNFVPVARPYGLVATNMGLGLVVERISGPGGMLAPTLQQVIALEGYSDFLAARLDYLMSQLEKQRIVISDGALSNIVVRADGTLIVVDGVGDPTYFKVFSRIGPLRKWKLNTVRARLHVCAREHHAMSFKIGATTGLEADRNEVPVGTKDASR